MMDEVSEREPGSTTLLLQAWSEGLSQALGEISGIPLVCRHMTETPPDVSHAADTDSWVLIAYSGATRGEMSLRLPASTTVRLAQTLMSEPAAPVEVTATHREAALELLRQVSGLVASRLKENRGEVQLHVEAASAAPSWPASSTCWFRIGEESPTIWIEANLSAALTASLRADQAEREKITCSQPSASLGSPAPVPRDGNANLDLLMDVELNVTLRFGQRRLLLRELLDLNPGSVIALDRHVQEPVDMLLDGRVVARGEVVVSSGRYALRVTEMGHPGM
ncbi:MAG TPA: FliM/FliN family flagellar motor switch protein [Dongiaceae bacterium]|nr:FliM/FliN family flagellar motor switch protein [Dongiaceae bacterium]